jgi:hypothetical protein
VEHALEHLPESHVPLQHIPLVVHAPCAGTHAMLHSWNTGSQTSPAQQSESTRQPTPAGKPLHALQTPVSEPGGKKHCTVGSQQSVFALQVPPTGAQLVPQRWFVSQCPLQQSVSSLQSNPFSPQMFLAHALPTHAPEQHWASIVQASPGWRHTTLPQNVLSICEGSGAVQSPAVEQQSPSLTQATPRVRQHTPPTQSASPLLKSQQSSLTVQVVWSGKQTGFRSRHLRAVAQLSRQVSTEKFESQLARAVSVARARLTSMRGLQSEGPPVE